MNYPKQKVMKLKSLFTVFVIIAILSLLSSFIPRDEINFDTRKLSNETQLVDSSEDIITDTKLQEKEEIENGIRRFFSFTGFANLTWGHLIMIFVGLFFIFLAIRFDYEPLLLIPIGLGVLIGNIPFMLDAGLKLGVYEEGSVLNYLYFGVKTGIYPPLIFLGIGAMTDFSSLISNPRLMLLGAAAQLGIFITFLGPWCLVLMKLKRVLLELSEEQMGQQQYSCPQNLPMV